MVRCKMNDKSGKIIAVTGGIGAGKSTVAKILKDAGYKVFGADETYKKLLKNGDFKRKIYNAIGLEYNGRFIKKQVADAVFGSPDKLKALNDATHSEIMRVMLEKSKKAALNSGGLVFNEVPLLFEGGFESLYDGVIVVVRNKEVRIAAALARDKTDEKRVLARINNQIDYEKKDLTAYTLIENDGDLSSLSKKVRKAVEKFIG